MQQKRSVLAGCPIAVRKSLVHHQQKEGEGERTGSYGAFRLQLHDTRPSQTSAAAVPVSKALLLMCSCHRTYGNHLALPVSIANGTNGEKRSRYPDRSGTTR